MSEDLKKILPCISDSYKWKTVSKNAPSEKKKLETIDKEVLNLTNGLFPLQPSSPFLLEKSKVKNEWIYCPIQFSNEQKPKQSQIYHWVIKSDKDKFFSYERFNIGTELEHFSEDDYKAFLQGLDPEWSYEETNYLWSLCEQYGLRFIVIHDRYDEKYHRSVEDLKARYYSVTKKLLEKKKKDTNNPLSHYIYDPDYEKTRKYHLEKFIMRPKEKNDEEKFLIEELKKIEQKIKKEEKEQLSLQKILKIEVKEEDLCDLENHKEDEMTLKKLNEEKQLLRKQKEKIAFLRGSIMHAPLPISAKINKKLNLVLSELNIPARPIPTSENEMLYDQLREQILIWFNLQKHLKKKEAEKASLEKRREFKYNEESLQTHMPNAMNLGEKRKYPFTEESMKMIAGHKKVKNFQ